MNYFTYMLKSISPGTKKTYVGYTNNVDKRLAKHNANKGAKSTKGYKWLLIYDKKFKSKNEAMSFEYKLKKNKALRREILEKSDK
ncbi:GIY-YIG nuclease family protein [Candidatus Pelagibacter sp.]|nr:GIY-YIG nuclease family protein [Candidatus Pelagibacter sp.]